MHDLHTLSLQRETGRCLQWISRWVLLACCALGACAGNKNGETHQGNEEAGGTKYEKVVRIDCENDQMNGFEEIAVDGEIEKFVDGIDLARLMADPASAEIQQASAEINRRNRSVKGLVEEDTFTVFIGEQKALARMVSHGVDDNRHYGGIIVPQTDHAGEKLPVLVYLNGFSQQFPSVWINQKNLYLSHLDAAYWHRFVVVIPSYRGQKLYFNDSSNHETTYQSEGQRNDAFDGAAEDALGLLNVALATVPHADQDRIVVLGASRGGTVALLMAQRDPRIKWVVSVVSPLDFMGSTLFQRTFDSKLLEEGIRSDYEIPTNLGEQYVYFFLEKLRQGEVTLETVRKKIIQSSPHYFASSLSQAHIQLHYGAEDISYVQLQRFHAQMEDLGFRCPQYQAYVYPNRGHDLIGHQLVEKRVKKFAARVLENGMSGIH